MTKRVLFLMFETGISGGNNILFNHVVGAPEDVEITVAASDDRFRLPKSPWHDVFNRPNVRFLPLSLAAQHAYDVVVPTYFETYYWLDRVRAEKVVYFVQSIEPRFFQNSLVDSERAALTYALPTGYVVVASWIGDFLRRTEGWESTKVRNGVNKALFTDKGRRVAARDPERLRVLVEGAPGAFFKNVPKTFQLLDGVPGIETWWLTPHAAEHAPGRVDRVFTGVPQAKVPAILRSCDVMVKLSSVEGMYGPPLEMFHCGGTVVTSDVTGHDEYVRHGENGVVVPLKALDGVTTAVRALAADRELLDRLRASALETAKAWPSREETAADFWRAIKTEAARSRVGTDEARRHLDTLKRLFRVYFGGRSGVSSLAGSGGASAAPQSPGAALLNALYELEARAAEHDHQAVDRLIPAVVHGLRELGVDGNSRDQVADLIAAGRAPGADPKALALLPAYMHARATLIATQEGKLDHAFNWFDALWHGLARAANDVAEHPCKRSRYALLSLAGLTRVERERHGSDAAWRAASDRIRALPGPQLAEVLSTDEVWTGLEAVAMQFLFPLCGRSPKVYSRGRLLYKVARGSGSLYDKLYALLALLDREAEDPPAPKTDAARLFFLRVVYFAQRHGRRLRQAATRRAA